MPSSRPHIIVDDLRIGWGARVLMEHVSFEVARGMTFVILGGSGSGKSTLLRYLIGLERPLAGKIDVDGVGDPYGYEGVPPFGVLFQSGALFSSMTTTPHQFFRADLVVCVDEVLRVALTRSISPLTAGHVSQRGQSFCHVDSDALLGAVTVGR